MPIPGSAYVHRGVFQLGLGQEARASNEGFRFDREKKEWYVLFWDLIYYSVDLTEDDIDEEFIESVLLHSINSGNEANPDLTGGGDGCSGGYGRAP